MKNNIKRYNTVMSMCHLQDDGAFMLYEDHIKAISELENENKKFQKFADFLNDGAQIEELEKKLAIAVETMKISREHLDGIKADLCASVYTVEDDEFAVVYFVRDILDEALNKIKELKS